MYRKSNLIIKYKTHYLQSKLLQSTMDFDKEDGEMSDEMDIEEVEKKPAMHSEECTLVNIKMLFIHIVTYYLNLIYMCFYLTAL